jgi:cyclophilin family peptidyl-prolyl cis-trans isomerase/protein-disulfide isomerase
MRRAILCLCLLLAACTTIPAATDLGTYVPVQLGATSTGTIAVPTRTPVPSTPTRPPVVVSPVADWTLGPAEAAVTLVVYSDFQCPLCAHIAPVLAQLQRAHPDDLRLVYRQYPLLPIHDKASLAGQAAEAAGAQDAFWPMHDLLFARWDEWVLLTPEDFLPWLVDAAGSLDLDVDRFREDLETGRYASVMDEAFEQGLAAGIPGTPFLFLNDYVFQLNPDQPTLEAAIRLELLATRQFTSYPPMIVDPDVTYIAHLELDSGELVIQLYAGSAPLAVNSFVFLARQGWYDDNPFFRVVPGTLVECGDPSGTGLGGPGYTYATEIDPTLHFDQPGTVGMSSAAPGANGSRFFIILSPQPVLDGSLTIFGRVTEGLELLQELGPRSALADILQPPEAIVRSVRIEER